MRMDTYMMPIHVVLAFDANMTLPAVATVTSLVHSLEGSSRVVFHCLGCDVPPADSARFRKVVSSLKGVEAVRFHDVDPQCLRGVRPVVHLTRAAAARLLLDKYVPTEINRVIYLDTDVICLRSIVPLASIEIGDKVVAAVTDMTTIPGFDRGATGAFDSLVQEFNTGVMLINLARWREGKWGDRTLARLEQMGDQATWMDQTALNAELIGKWHPISPVWNAQFAHLPKVPESPPSPFAGDLQMLKRSRAATASICHFVGRQKPWNSDYRHPFLPAYLDLVKDSGWFSAPAYCAWRTGLQIATLHRTTARRLRDFPGRLWRAASRHFSVSPPTAALNVGGATGADTMALTMEET